MNQGTLILILGDQLSPALSSLAEADRSSAIILLAEVAEEASYVLHHKKNRFSVFGDAPFCGGT